MGLDGGQGRGHSRLMVLRIDLTAIRANYRALSERAPGARTAAVVKADAYGLGAAQVAPALAQDGVSDFFVALAHEAVALRRIVGPKPRIFVLSGPLSGADFCAETYVLNSPEQFFRHRAELRGRAFAIQLDTGMNRLGFEPSEFEALKSEILAAGPVLLMSHLACADTPDHPMNPRQLEVFRQLTDGLDIPRSLAATGGILLGPAYHFDLVRPGIGLYGCLPHADGLAVVALSLDIAQTRTVKPGETVGYANSWTADRPTRVATVAAGYADGLHRALSSDGPSPRIALYADSQPCPVIGRVSMDLITVDVSALSTVPQRLDLICAQQSVDDVADAIGTIGYEMLTSLGNRYQRIYT